MRRLPFADIRKLAWRTPLAALLSLVFSLFLAGLLLALASLVADTDGRGSAGLTAVRALAPVLLFGATTGD